MLTKAVISSATGGISANRSAMRQKATGGIIGSTFEFPAMACTHFLNAVRLRLTLLTKVLAACARVLRAQQTQRHGMPTAFVSLSGVTAMLSAAVRMA